MIACNQILKSSLFEYLHFGVERTNLFITCFDYWNLCHDIDLVREKLVIIFF